MSARRSGSLLVITLWLVLILSGVAVAVAHALSREIRIAKYRLAVAQAKALARSGVYLAIQRLADDARAPESDGKVYDWLGDDWAVGPQQGSESGSSPWLVPMPQDAYPGSAAGQAAVHVTDEERKLALNSVSPEQLSRLGVEEAVAQAVIDARDEPDTAEDRPDDTPPYVAKNGPFATLEELTSLPGMTPQLYETLTAGTSPYLAASQPMNLNTVVPEALRAVGVSENTVQLILRFREGLDGPEAHEQDGIFKEAGVAILQTLKDQQGVDLTGTADGNLLISNLFGVTSETFTVTSEGILEHPALRVRVQAVVRRHGCGDGVPSPCIVAWREN